MAWTPATNILDGVNALGALLSGVDSKIDNVDSVVDSILAAINDTNNGLTAIKAAVDAIDANTLETNVAAIRSAVESTTYGLAKIKSYLIG